jgi:hypothetical protein
LCGEQGGQPILSIVLPWLGPSFAKVCSGIVEPQAVLPKTVAVLKRGSS